MQGSLLDVHVLPNDTTLTILRQEFHWTRSLNSDSSEDSDQSLENESTESESQAKDSSESDSEMGNDCACEEIIRPAHQKRVVHWLKRLFSWWQDYRQDF